MQEIEEMKRQGLSIRAINRLTGYDQKTISKVEQDAAPPSRPGEAYPMTTHPLCAETTTSLPLDQQAPVREMRGFIRLCSTAPE